MSSLKWPAFWISALVLSLDFLYLSRFPRHSKNVDHQDILAMSVRPATKADLDQITALGLAALPDDPIWPYRFPGAKAHADHHYKYSRIRFSEYLDNVDAGVYSVMVVEAPSIEDPQQLKIISMSMWALPGWHSPEARSKAGGDPPLQYSEGDNSP
jgi:hypothetical protein